MEKPSVVDNFAKEKILANLSLAHKYLKAAKFTSRGEQNNTRLVIDAAYNTVELCIKGLLLLKLKSIPKTHGGLVQKFGEYYIKTGILPRKVGRLSNRMLRYRNKARYDAEDKEVESLKVGKEALGFAEEMIQYLEEEIKKYK